MLLLRYFMVFNQEQQLISILFCHQRELMNQLKICLAIWFKYVKKYEKSIALNLADYVDRANIKRKDKSFEVGNSILILLHPKRYSPGSFTKLHARISG